MNQQTADGLPENNRGLIAALSYLRNGWNVIPIQAGGKVPLIEWTSYQKQRTTEAELRLWFKTWPKCNIAIVTGKISGLVVVDLDGLEGIKTGISLKLRSTVTTLTTKGKHLYYKCPENEVKNSVRLLPGLDIRAEGGYVLAPPSYLTNGKRYRWERFSPTGLVPLPTTLTTLMLDGADVTSQRKESKPEGWIAKALEEMKIGNIDNTLVSILGRLRRDGWTAPDALAVLKPIAMERGATDGHLEDKIKNVWSRYEPRGVSKSEMSEWGGTYALHNSSQRRDGTGNAQSGLVLHSPSNPDSLIEYRKRCEDSVGNSQSLSTGYTQFDSLTKGLKKGEVLAVCARTGVGKTNWVLPPIKEFCQNGKRVLLFSTEMSFDQIWSRYIPLIGTFEDVKTHQFFVCDEFTPDINRIEEAIKNVQPDLFIFDHISHIGTDYHIISKFMSEIKRLARLYGLPAIVTAQLNRNADYVEQGQRIEPRLSMIQGSDQIGQMSAQVLLLNEKRVANGETEIEGIVVKNRHGDRGMIQFILKREPYRMEENV